MTPGFNFFRITGDCLHLLSKCILIFSIHRNRSAEGVSLITQVLYATVFCARYLNVFQEFYLWNLFFKLFYITSSFYIIVLMRWIYPRSREMELAWKMGAVITVGSLLLSPFGMLIFVRKQWWSFEEVMRAVSAGFCVCLSMTDCSLQWAWSFSEILEAFAVLPQLLLLRQTTVPTVIDSYYLLALGSYRGFYILNWIKRATDPADHKPNGLSVTFGVLQVLFYLDFAWVYWTRQRVKLRNGGIVDADDIRQGWLLRRIFGKHVDQAAQHDEFGGAGTDDEESAPALGGRGGGSTGNGTGSRRGRGSSKWGSRGISVSADDTTLEHERLFEAERSDGHHNLDASVDPDAKMQDPDELARVLDDDDEDDEDDEDGAPPPPGGRRGAPAGESSGVRNDEWAD
ncbi:protein-er retention protein [Niveomyces insectorum RCEF 264]|uniref:Protein-er retention protein n=1 Tax=Niveomyces insectorum RCEF 264 TaxID=1081102 RepID=A0A167Q7N4_9HYPO|nr:protein-er retention protein [Niveomyces insectorum RCEF 264]